MNLFIIYDFFYFLFKKYFDIGNVVISDHENWAELKFSLNFSDILPNCNKQAHFFKFYTQVKNFMKEKLLLFLVGKYKYRLSYRLYLFHRYESDRLESAESRQ